MTISRRILLAKLGIIVPAAAFLTATGLTAAHAAAEDGTATPAAHHSRKKHHASRSHRHKTASKGNTTG